MPTIREIGTLGPLLQGHRLQQLPLVRSVGRGRSSRKTKQRRQAVPDAAVDAAYGKQDFMNDAERVAFLFYLYRKYTSLLLAGGIPAAKRTAGKRRPV